MFVIYKIFSRSLNKVIYIGCTKNFKKRKYDHLRGFKHSYSHYKDMYKNFKEDDICIDVIEIKDNSEDALKSEKYWIYYYNTHEQGYNSCPYGHASFYGKKHKDETCKKISDKNKNKKISEDNIKRMKENNPMKDEKTRLKMIESQKKLWTDERRKIWSEKLKGRSGTTVGLSGEKAVNGKKVMMFNENMELIKEFKTIQLALDYLGLKGHVGLRNAIKNNCLYKGYYWKGG